MTIASNFYLYGSTYITPDLPDNYVIRALKESRHEFTYCDDCNGITVFDFSGAFAYGDNLDRSNAEELSVIHDPRAGTYLHAAQDKLCFALELIEDTEEEWVDYILDIHNGFQDYPALNDERMSELDFADWNNEIEWQLSKRDIVLEDMPKEWVVAFTDSMSNWYGYSEPGYVDDVWVDSAIEFANSNAS